MTQMVVISCGLNVPPERSARASVAAQRGADVRHIVIDADKQEPIKTKLHNIYDTVMALPPDAIVCSVDLDDALAHDGALARVHQEYADTGCWLTYGSYRLKSGQPGIARPSSCLQPRREEWLTTHLKSFRAGLFQSVPKPYLLQDDGSFISLCTDVAKMMAMIELAGPERCRFIPDVLYVYNLASSYEFRALAPDIAAEKASEMRIRRMTPLSRLTERPW